MPLNSLLAEEFCLRKIVYKMFGVKWVFKLKTNFSFSFYFDKKICGLGKMKNYRYSK